MEAPDFQSGGTVRAVQPKEQHTNGALALVDAQSALRAGTSAKALSFDNRELLRGSRLAPPTEVGGFHQLITVSEERTECNVHTK